MILHQKLEMPYPVEGFLPQVQQVRNDRTLYAAKEKGAGLL
jgi:hypothetical protein